MAGVRRRLGEVLTAAGLISREQLQAALGRRKQTGERLGRALVSLGYLTAEDIAQALGQQLGLEFLPSAAGVRPTEASAQLGEESARRYRVVPLSTDGKRLKVAMDDPLNAFAQEQAVFLTGRDVSPVVCTEPILDELLEVCYGHPEDSFQDFGLRPRPGSRQSPAYAPAPGTAARRPLGSPAEREIPSLANRLLLQALGQGATELHLEPGLAQCHIRARASGLMRDLSDLPAETYRLLVTHFRHLAGLDLTDLGLTAQGLFEMSDDDCDVFVSMNLVRMPGGDRAVLRLVDQAERPESLEALGLGGQLLARYRELTRLPAGLVLVASTRQAGLRSILRTTAAAVNDPGKMVAYLETDHSMPLPRVPQIDWGPGRPLDARGAVQAARSQDADVLIVAGALENPDAAREVIRAALEGCLVVAGLVAASSEAALRKLDLLGTGGTVLAGVCRGILAHRPARRTCQACAGRMALAPPPARAGDPRAGGAQAAGCENCDWTGYEGTTGLFELALPDDEAAPGRKILHVREGLTFAADARAKVAARLLDEAEALRVLGRDPDSGALPTGVALEGKAR